MFKDGYACFASNSWLMQIYSQKYGNVIGFDSSPYEPLKIPLSDLSHLMKSRFTNPSWLLIQKVPTNSPIKQGIVFMAHWTTNKTFKKKKRLYSSKWYIYIAFGNFMTNIAIQHDQVISWFTELQDANVW